MKRILALAALAFGLSGCFVVVPSRPTQTTQPVQTITPVNSAPTPVQPVFTNTNPRPINQSLIQEFQSERGNGGRYRVGESVAFRVRVSVNGYITLMIYNEDQWDPTPLYNIPVRAGQLNLVPPLGTISAAEPVGTTRVRAFFTPQPTGSNFFVGVNGVAQLQGLSISFTNSYPADTCDFEDTFVVVVR